MESILIFVFFLQKFRIKVKNPPPTPPPPPPPPPHPPPLPSEQSKSPLFSLSPPFLEKSFISTLISKLEEVNTRPPFLPFIRSHVLLSN